MVGEPREPAYNSLSELPVPILCQFDLAISSLLDIVLNETYQSRGHYLHSIAVSSGRLIVLKCIL